MKTYQSLQELTGHEAGAIQYSDGEIWVGNWVGIEGIPRQFVTGMIGLGEPLTAERCATPLDVLRAMQAHECEQGSEAVSQKGFHAWRVNQDTVIVIQSDWN